MMATEIKKCNCESEYQDNLYGKQNRVMNKREKQGGYKCTVCGAIVK